MQFGWSAPFLPILLADDSPIKITESDIDWLESVYMIGGLAGLPITIYMVDKIGRQKTVLFASSSSFTAWVSMRLSCKMRRDVDRQSKYNICIVLSELATNFILQLFYRECFNTLLPYLWIEYTYILVDAFIINNFVQDCC